jgi:hypothetical protein
MEIEARQTPHIFIFVDEAGFKLAKTRRRGRNVIGKRATVDVPGQRGANITMRKECDWEKSHSGCPGPEG